jgi:hypothetical protein
MDTFANFATSLIVDFIMASSSEKLFKVGFIITLSFQNNKENFSSLME